MNMDKIAKAFQTADNYGSLMPGEIKALILAWIHAEARAREAEHDVECHNYYSQGLSCTRCQDWIAVVKREVDWVED